MSAVVIPRSDHPVSRKNIDECALRVLYRLYRNGHAAYLVGGGVRDLLLGLEPKDFDVATDAHPGRIRKLFRNCVLVGRRFRLAHIRFGRTIIETSTFRKPPEPPGEASSEGSGGEDLLIKHDNTFGTPEDDALRRDFTVNALFYDIGTYSLIDYVGGMRDVEDGCIRSIGEPAVRYQEDPVRMMRAVKFAARLGFEIVPKDLAAIKAHGEKLQQASTPRLLEEIFKLLRGGAAAGTFRLLDDTGLLRVLLPEVADYLKTVTCDATGEGEDLRFYRSLFGIDELKASDSTVEPSNALLLAALLYPMLDEELLDETDEDLWAARPEEVEAAFEAVIRPVLRRFTVARRDGDSLLNIMLAQKRLLTSKRYAALGRQPWLHDAVEVLKLGARSDEELGDDAKRWDKRAAAMPRVKNERRRTSSRPRKRRRSTE